MNETPESRPPTAGLAINACALPGPSTASVRSSDAASGSCAGKQVARYLPARQEAFRHRGEAERHQRAHATVAASASQGGGSSNTSRPPSRRVTKSREQLNAHHTALWPGQDFMTQRLHSARRGRRQGLSATPRLDKGHHGGRRHGKLPVQLADVPRSSATAAQTPPATPGSAIRD